MKRLDHDALYEQADEYACDELDRLIPDNKGTEDWYDGAREAIANAKFNALLAEAMEARAEYAMERAEDHGHAAYYGSEP